MKDIWSEAEIVRYHFHTRERVVAIRPMVLPYIDITYCIEGEMRYLLDGEPITLSSSDAILFPKGAVRVRFESDAPTTYASLNLLLPSALPLPARGLLRHTADADTLYLLKRLYACYTTASPKREEKCKALLSYLYYALGEAALGGGNPYVMQIKQMILDDPTAHYTLSELAERVHLAPGYLCALFKKHEGCSLFEYIGRRRIDYAKRCILSYDTPLSEIAERCGFSDYHAFSHAFKLHEGISAMQFKKRKNELASK